MPGAFTGAKRSMGLLLTKKEETVFFTEFWEKYQELIYGHIEEVSFEYMSLEFRGDAWRRDVM